MNGKYFLGIIFEAFFHLQKINFLVTEAKKNNKKESDFSK